MDRYSYLENVSKKILEILKDNEITLGDLYLLFEIVKDEFKKVATIKKD